MGRSRRECWTRLVVPFAVIAFVAYVSGGDVRAVADTTQDSAVAVEPAATCGVSPPSDAAPWERALPTADVSSELSASDPGCVREVGRTADSVAWANPDGTVTARQYLSDVNYQAADGSWQAIDTRLVSDGDGGTINKAGPFEVRLGGRADAEELVSLKTADASLSIAFDGATRSDSAQLEEPAHASSRVSGGSDADTLTYAEVMPDVDLQYQLLPDALKEVIVLDGPLPSSVTPEFVFSLALKGMQPQTAKDGTVQFVNTETGAVAFSIPPGLASDSSGNADEGIDPALTPVLTRLVASADPSVARLIISIDPVWLNDSARMFPVMIDPSFTSGISTDVYVANTAPTTTYDGAGQYNAGAGQYWARAGTTGGTNYRSMTLFPSMTWLEPYHIVSAVWWGYAYSVGGGTGIPIDLKPLNGAWPLSGMNWNNQPAVRSNVRTVNYSAGSQWRTADITSWVENWADGSWGQYGIRLHGPNSKYANLAAHEAPASVRSFIQITYDAYAKTSRWSAGGTYVDTAVNTGTPTLSAQIDDTDTPSGLHVKYQVWNASKTTLLSSGNGTTVKTGERSTWTVPGLFDGSYFWRASGWDGTVQTGWSAWMPLTVDTVADSPPVFWNMPTLNAWSTGTSVSPQLVAGSHGFLWGIDVGNDPSTFAANLGGIGNLGAIDLRSGWHDLSARAIDQAGNLSTIAHFTFGLNDGGFITPHNGFITQSGIAAQVVSKPSYDGVAFQWRRSESGTWQTIPAGDVTYQSSGAGISSWPVTTTPGTFNSSFPSLVWDAASTTSGVDGPLQTRIAFYTSGVVQSYLDAPSTLNGSFDQFAFGGGAATAPAGPGRANLLTGNLTLGAADAGSSNGTVTRRFQSLNQDATGSVFGPGWNSNLLVGHSEFVSLTDDSEIVLVGASDGSKLGFRKQTDGSYLAPDGATDLTLTKVSASRFELAGLKSRTYGFTNYDGNATGTFLPSDVVDPTTKTATMSWAVDSGTGLTRPIQMVDPAPAGISCSSSPLTTRGCRTLTFDYATSTTATGTSPSDWGDFSGQIATVRYTAWDPELTTPAMSTIDVATYRYDDTGRLRSTWDPRISPALKTTYSYDGYGHIETVKPPGEEAWTFNYAPLSGEAASTGRISTVSRPTLPSGTATSTFVYKIPLTTASGGPYNLDAGTVASWAQHDTPVTATALFPPDQTPSGTPPSSYTRATVAYMNLAGQKVNIAEPGGYIATSEHDLFGNVTRELTAANRARALSSAPSSSAQAAQSVLLDTQARYTPDGINVVDTLGPAHMVDLPDGTSRTARQHFHYVYDEGAPSGAAYNLITTRTEAAAPTDGTPEQDLLTTAYKYAIGSDTSGWTLRTPMQTIVDPGPTPHLNLTTTKLYDVTTGNLVARRLPANPSGGDAHETNSIAYTAGTNPQDAACGNRPEWAELLCKHGPAAQPGTAGLPDLSVTLVSKYNQFRQPLETIETNGSDNRTTILTYDAAGRSSGQAIASTLGVSLPDVVSTYDSSTGRIATTSDGALTISRIYDTLGHLTDYYDADGNHSSYTYDQLDRVSTLNNGKATTTYAYDNVGGEHRGLPTTISDPVAGDFTATYDADGRLATQTYPGSLTATYTYDAVGEGIGLSYSKSTGIWPASSATYDIHGRRTSSSDSLESFIYKYDPASRLTQVTDSQTNVCTKRNYTFDADANRTQLVTATTGGAGNIYPCLASGGTTVTANSSFDDADRLTTGGEAYDALGRTTAAPASEIPRGTATTMDYFDNDMVHEITTNGIATTYQLEPTERVRSWTSTADSQTRTHHYLGDGDRPTWTSENTAGTVWTRYVTAFAGLAASVTNASSVTLNLVNLHGDIFSFLPASATDWLSSSTWSGTDEYGKPTNGGTGSRYDYLGSKQRQRDTNSGLQLMGARLYNAQTGRFLQPDPIEAGSCSAYDYACGDPINAQDTTGRARYCPCPIYGWKIVGFQWVQATPVIFAWPGSWNFSLYWSFGTKIRVLVWNPYLNGGQFTFEDTRTHKTVGKWSLYATWQWYDFPNNAFDTRVGFDIIIKHHIDPYATTLVNAFYVYLEVEVPIFAWRVVGYK